MRLFKNQDEAYNWCTAEGNYVPVLEVEENRIKANLTIAKEDLASAKDAITKKRFNSAYKIHYDVLHVLVEAYLLFDNIKSKNHLCLFTYICVKHPDLELHWNFFEKVRTKRNGIHYYGTLVTEQDWKEVALEFQLNINLLMKKIEGKLE